MSRWMDEAYSNVSKLSVASPTDRENLAVVVDDTADMLSTYSSSCTYKYRESMMIIENVMLS